MSPKSALPSIYYAIFAVYEPFLAIVGLIGTVFDPQKVHSSQAPGTSPLEQLPPATLVTLLQLAHTCWLLGFINLFVLNAAKIYIVQLPVQEKIVAALLTPLLFGDVFHLAITFYALGEYPWNLSSWSPLLTITVVTGISLFIPRVCWHLGLGRYVASRDGIAQKHHDAASIAKKAVLR